MRPWHSPSLPGAMLMLFVAPGPVVADCDPAGAPEEVVAGAPVAFVGTVTGLDGTTATLAVEEVWVGSLPNPVEVKGIPQVHPHGPEPAGPTEDDRAWAIGGTYLVIPRVSGGVLYDDICTATVAWSDELAALRPADAVIHGSGEEAPAAPSLIPAPLLAAVAAAAVVATVSVLAFRRRGEQSR